MRSRPFRRYSKPIRPRLGSWASTARILGEILSSSRLATRSHSASTRALAAESRKPFLSPYQAPGESSDLSTGGLSADGHLLWYSPHIPRASAASLSHFFAAARSSG